MKYPRKQGQGPAGSRKTKRDRALESMYEGDEERDLKTIERRKGGSRGLTLVLLIVFIGLGIGAYISSKPGLLIIKRTQKNEATLTIAAEEQTALLTPYTLKLAIDPGKNSIKAGAVSVFLPNGFVLEKSVPEASTSPAKKEKQWNLDPKNPRQTITLTGVFMGNIDEEQSFRAVLNYKPLNFDSDFQSNALHTVELTETPITFSLDALEQVFGGEEKTYTLTIKNNSERALQNLAIVPPQNSPFNITDSGADELLKIKDLDTGAEITQTLHGSFAGDARGTIPLDWKLTTTFDGTVYVIAKIGATVAVQEQPILIGIALLENLSVARPSDVIKGEVRYQNKTAEALKNVTIKLTITAPAKKRDSILDWTRLDTTGSPKVEGVQINDGARSGVITWSPELIPTLKNVAPGVPGVLSFTLPIKSSGAFDFTPIGAADIRIEAVATTGEQMLSAQPVAVPLVADTSVQAGAVKAGDTVVVQWTVNHHFHTVKDTRVTAHLFGNIGWLDQSDTSAGEIQYDSVTRTVTWNIGTLVPTDGVTTASFAVKVEKPDPTQTLLMDETTLTATDETAGRPISRTVPGVKMPR